MDFTLLSQFSNQFDITFHALQDGIHGNTLVIAVNEIQLCLVDLHRSKAQDIFADGVEVTRVSAGQSLNMEKRLPQAIDPELWSLRF